MYYLSERNMKLRCIENSIRLRLRKSDIKELKETGQTKQEVNIPGGVQFKYKLCIEVSLEEIAVGYTEQELCVSLPEQLAMSWIDSNQVGIESSLTLPDGASLAILIEKDFPCRDGRDEDRADTFFELDENETC